MSTEANRPAMIGGVFAERSAAVGAARALTRIGAARDDTMVLIRRGEGLVIEPRPGRLMSSRVVSFGAALALAGAATAALVAVLAWPDRAVRVALAFAGAGAIVGLVVGGFIGLSRLDPPGRIEEEWLDTPVPEGHVLVVVPDVDGVAEIVRTHGGDIVEPGRSRPS